MMRFLSVSRKALFSDLFFTMVNSSDLSGISGISEVRFSHTHIRVSWTSSSARTGGTKRVS